MRPFLLLLILLIGCFAFGQIEDSFEDNNFLNPTWLGDTLKFDVRSGKLVSSSTIENDTFYIATRQTLADEHEWRLWLDLDFNTSSANYVDFFLVSDTQDLQVCRNGLYLKIGNTKDELGLYGIENGNHLLLADGPDKQTENATINLKITKDSAINIYADYTGNSNFQLIFSLKDTFKHTGDWCGILVQQSTSSFFGKHLFDDFYSGPVQIDSILPSILSYQWKDNKTLELICNEPIELTAQTRIELLPTYSIPTESKTDAETIELTWQQGIVNGEYTLSIQNVFDLSNNSLDTSFSISFYQAPKPKPGDLLISEIMADPSPSAGLPEVEYIEIWNITNTLIDLDSLTITDGSSSGEIENEEIAPHEHLLICKSGDATSLRNYGRVIELSQFPALNNAGDDLQLLLNGNIIDHVNYTDDWYGDESKEDGGYALELIDTGNTCKPKSNWRVSNALKGGSPGEQSSLFGLVFDSLAPQLLDFTAEKDKLVLALNEEAEELRLSLNANFTVAETAQHPSTISQKNVGNWELIFTDTFQFNTIYHLDISSLTDCLGNDNLDLKIPFVRLLQPQQGEIVINELLFNPRANAYDFIELRNNSSNILDISALQLARINDNQLEDIESLASNELALFPGEYIALTEDTSSLRKEYTCGDFLLQTAIPPMNNDAGTIVLLDKDGFTLDSLTYSEEQHFELLNNVDGVSLERISFSAPTYQTTNWTSASSSVGFATPALPNSQALDNQTTEIDIAIGNTTFSPDGDGYQDVLQIQYRVDEPGFIANVYIYALNGSLVFQPINNETLATKGVLFWDGILNTGEKIRIGNYIALVELYNLDGKQTKKKLAFSVVGQF